ncbi:MAG: 2-hydroxyacyl-CoA dehydratase family protein [Firmicutes bacterium]|nr:2-hydroxyacyl-CoA dehydratase family protein [Bacillota bacterium]
MTSSIEQAGPVQLLLKVGASGGSGWSRLYPEGPPFGYFCSYWPEELVLSLGWEPYRMLPASANATPGRLPAFCCSLARACLAAAEAGEYRELAGVGFGHTCDTIQSLAGIWPHERTFLLVPPVALQAPGALAYHTAQLASLWRRLAGQAGKEPDPAALRRAIRLTNRIRALAGRLDEMRPRLPSPLVSAILRAGQIMPREAYAAALEAALPELAGAAASPQGRRRLLISGPALENDGLYELLEELGARVVADDTCTGHRHFTGLVAEDEEPLAAIAGRYASIPACPCRFKHLDDRPDHLAALARDREADGVILVVRKYCDPHAWDAVSVAKRLRGEGLPVLVLEMQTATPGEQERTRVQAFLECL